VPVGPDQIRQGRPPRVQDVVVVARLVREADPALGAEPRTVLPAHRLERQHGHYCVPQHRLKIDGIVLDSTLLFIVFSIGEHGELNEVQRISCGGKTPRHFTLDPTAQWVLCGNQDSATITVFRRDQGTGKLAGPIGSVPVDSPMFTLFA